MPRYIGERRGEMYYQRDGKWHHCRDNGRCFNSLESAQRDFNKVYREPPGYSFAWNLNNRILDVNLPLRMAFAERDFS